jgi:hypothetical protein
MIKVINFTNYSVRTSISPFRIFRFLGISRYRIHFFRSEPLGIDQQSVRIIGVHRFELVFLLSHHTLYMVYETNQAYKFLYRRPNVS